MAASGMSPRKAAALEAQLEAEAAELKAQTDLAEGDRATAMAALDERKRDLQRVQREHRALEKRFQALQKRVIVGGVDLLAKDAEQQHVLETAREQLQDRMLVQGALRQKLHDAEAERIDVEEKYGSLQEEAEGIKKKIKKVARLLRRAESENEDLRVEQQRQTEELLESVRQLKRELAFEDLVIDSFIPAEHQEFIAEHIQWSEEVGEWQLTCIAYAGNSLGHPEAEDAAAAAVAAAAPPPTAIDGDADHVYLDYGPAAHDNLLREKNAKAADQARGTHRNRHRKKKTRRGDGERQE